MNWDAINAISQFVSSIAVVFSVLYLAKEVHRSTRVARVAAQDAAASAVREGHQDLHGKRGDVAHLGQRTGGFDQSLP